MDQTFCLDLNVSVFGDARGNMPDFARYTVELSPDKDDHTDPKYQGKYAGTWRGVDVSGEAEATILPATRPPPPGFKPLGVDERPRILFRQSDLPDLRRRAKTGLGTAAMEVFI